MPTDEVIAETEAMMREDAAKRGQLEDEYDVSAMKPYGELQAGDSFNGSDGAIYTVHPQRGTHGELMVLKGVDGVVQGMQPMTEEDYIRMAAPREEVAPKPQAVREEQASEEQVYNPGDAVIVRDENGNEVAGRIVSMPDADGKYQVETETAVNGKRVHEFTREELDGMKPVDVQEETEREAGRNVDKQGNPLNADGSLAVEAIGSIDELTDEDFLNPVRNVQLPRLSEKVDAAIGANGKPVVIKKNIFERNTERHSDLTPDDGRKILLSALYNPDLYGQNQKRNRPYNWVVINTKDSEGVNRLVLLEVNENKDNIEIVHWHYLDERGLEKIRRQAMNEDGQLLILPSENSKEVGALSDPIQSLSSESKVNSSEGEKQEAEEEKVSAMAKIPLNDKKEPDFEAAPVADTVAALLELNDNNADEARDTANQMVDVYQKKLKEAEKASTKGNDVMQITALKKAKAEKIKAIGERIAYWNEVAKQLTPKKSGLLAESEALSEANQERLAAMSAEEQRAAQEAVQKKIDRGAYDRKEARSVRYGDEDIRMGEANSAMEHVLREIATGRVKFLWRGKGQTQGLGAHLGLSNSETERKKFIWALHADGMTPEVASERIYENMSEQLEATTDQQGVFNMILDAFQQYGSPSKMWEEAKRLHGTGFEENLPGYDEYIEKQRLEWEAEQNHMSLEEWAAYCDYIRDEIERRYSSLTEEEINAIFEQFYEQARLEYEARRHEESARSTERQGDHRQGDGILHEQGVDNTGAAESSDGRQPGSEDTADGESRGVVSEQELAEEHGSETSRNDKGLSEKIAAAEAETDTHPTDKQKEAGNYKKGHVQVGVFDITIEQPKGSVRSGVDADGNKWETTMQNTYGYIRGTEGVDGDHIDVFLSDDIDGWNGRKVFVVDQYNEDGTFDEHKVMLGFNSQEDAEAAYFANYDKDWAKRHKTVVTAVNLEDFEKWIDSSHRKTKAFAEYKGLKSDVAQKEQGDDKTVREQFGSYKKGDKFIDDGPFGSGKVLALSEFTGSVNNPTAILYDEKGNVYKELYSNIGTLLIPINENKKNTRKKSVKAIEGKKEDVREQRGKGKKSVSGADAALRDALTDKLRESGIEVLTDSEAAQMVLDEANGKARTMSFGEEYDYEQYPNGRVEPGLADKVVHVERAELNHGFANFDEAREWAKKNIVRTLNNEESGGKGNVKISGTAVNKYLSESAVAKSDSKDIHLAVLKKLPDVIRESIDVETTPDFQKDENGERKAGNPINEDVLIHRCYGAVEIDGNIYRVKITLKEYKDAVRDNKAYSYEATKIELLAGTLVGGDKSSNPGTNNSLSAANLLKDVDMSYNPSVKVLEESKRVSQKHRFFRTANGEAYGFTVDGKIYLDPRIATAETPIHEYAHLWADALRRINPKEWDNVVELMKGTPVWEEVKKLYPELKTDNEIADEVLAHYSGRRGAERLRAEQQAIANGEGSLADKATAISALERVKESLKKFWKGVADWLGIHFTTAEEVADKVLADLLNGVNPMAADGMQNDKKELIAVHNISEDKLKQAFELGGFPMPSIAITKAGVGHTTFGDISLVFDKESINPTDKRNKVYGEDAWTPVFPSMGYKLNTDKTNSIYSRASKVGKMPMFNPADFHPTNYENSIDERGDASLVEHFEEDYGAKQLYLSETGNAVTEFEQINVEKYLPESVALSEKLLKEIGIERLKNDGYDELKDEIKQLINQHYGIDLDSKKPFFAKARIQNTIHRAIDYAENGNQKTESDIETTKAKIDERIDNEKFREWLEDLFTGVVEKRGIRNDRDWFTPSGNRRKWEQLYDEITLDNVVAAMQKQAAKGGEGLFGGSIFGSAQSEYKSIDDIRNAAKERIRTVNEEDYQAQRSAITDRLSAIDIPGSGSDFSATMEMTQNIQDAVAKSHAAKGIHKYLKKFYPRITMEIANEIADIVKDIQHMSARYFEAKPYRAVGFDEVKLAVVPSDTDPSIVNRLGQLGIEVRTYDKGNQTQRKQIVEEATEDLRLRFQFVGEKGAANMDKAEEAMISPLEMSEEEKRRRGEQLRNAPAVDVVSGQIVKTEKLSARKAAEEWWGEHVPFPLHYQTEIGEVVIDANSIENSLAHRYGQAKLDAITSLKDGFGNAVYLGSLKDFTRDGNVHNHYFAYPIEYNGERCYVFCRTLHDANKNGLYVHEVFVADKIKKGNTLQTAASQPHGGIALYKDILANVLDAANVQQTSENASIAEEEIANEDLLYREVTDKETIRELESQPTIKAYRAMQVIDGQLYSPMASGKKKGLGASYGLNKWDVATEMAFNLTDEMLAEVEQLNNSNEKGHVDVIPGVLRFEKGSKTGKATLKYHLVTDETDVWAAYNPYNHNSDSMLNDQFKAAYRRGNLVVVESEVPVGDLESGYRAPYAKDAVGKTEWKSGDVAAQLPDEMKRTVYLSRYTKPVRILSNTEVAKWIGERLRKAEELTGEPITLYEASFHPEVKKLLEADGFKFVPVKQTKGKVSRIEKGHPDYMSDERIAEANERLGAEAPWLKREGDGVYTDEELSYVNDPIARVMGKPRGTARQRRAFAERERQRMAARVTNLAEKLHLDNVEVVTDASTLAGRQQRAKGFYNKQTGKITVVLPNHASAHDVEQTLLHEAVAHYGLRKLFGEHFDTFLDNVFENAEKQVRKRIIEKRRELYGKYVENATKGASSLVEKAGIIANLPKQESDFTRTATEEYLASLAEETDFENLNASWWHRIKNFFIDMLHRIGFEDFGGVTLTDNELRYLLWRSYENLAEPGKRRSLVDETKDAMKQYELGVGNYAGSSVPTDGLVAEAGDLEEVNARFNAELERLTEENADKINFNLGNPSEKLLSAGVTDRPIRLHGSKVAKKMKKHGFAIEELRDLPRAIANPIAVFDNLGRDGNRSVLTELRTANGNFLVTIDLGKGTEADFDIVSSVFGKRKDSVAGWVNKGYMRYVDKEKALNYLHLSAPIAEASDNTELLSATKIVEEFENPTISGEKYEEDELYRDGDPVVYERRLARDLYEERLQKGMYQAQEAMQDSMLSVKEAMQAILGKRTNIEDVAGFENAYIGENRLSSVNQAEAEAFARTVFQPLLDEVAKLAKNDAQRVELTDYMMAKHGLERNRVMAKRKAAAEARKEFANELSQAQKAVDKDPLDFLAANQLDDVKQRMQDREEELFYEYRENDFAGLTALTGKGSVAEAEAEAGQMVQDYEQSHDTTELWDKMRGVSRGILSKAYECGLMDKETYRDIASMYDYYIPLRGFDEKTSADAYAYLSHKESAFNAPIKTAKGRRSKADDPLAYLESMAESTIMQGNRNKLVKQRFLNFALNHPSDLVSVSELWLAYDEVTDEWKPVFPDNIEETDTPEEVERKMQDFEAKMQTLAEQEPDKYKHGKDTAGIPYRVVEKKQERQHQVVVKRNGRDYVLTVNGNPRLAQALNGQTNPNNDLSGVLGYLSKTNEQVNRFLSAMYTTRNPDFVVSNFVRDMLYSNTMVWIKESPNYARLFNKHCTTTANPANMKRLLTKYRNGKLDMNDKTEALFYQFMLNGGETGYSNIRDIEKHKNEINRALKKANGQIPLKQAFDYLGERLDEYNRAIENSARFAAFVTSREMGRTVDRAIYDAKEISVNFNKKGSGAKFVGANGQTKLGNMAAAVSGAGRTFQVFWNAAVQGMANFGKQAKRHPKKMLTLSSSVFILGALMAYLGDDDEDELGKNSYYNLPETVRRSHIVFRAGDYWATIPLPVEFRAVYGIGELLTGTLSGKVHLTNYELANQLAGQLSQLLPLDLVNTANFSAEGSTWRERGLNGVVSVLPSSVKGVGEVLINRGWTGLPVWKDNPHNKHMPEWSKAYKNANKQLVNLAATLNEWSGGDEFAPGKINLNPAAIEYLFNAYLGGAYKTVDKMVKTAETIMGKREFNPQSLLLVNRLVKQSDDRTQYRNVTNEFYRVKLEHDITKDRYNKYDHSANLGLRDYAEKIYMMNESPEFERMLIFDAFQTDMNDIQTQMKEVPDKESQEMLEEELYLLRKLMLEEMKPTWDKAKSEEKKD